MTKVEKPRSVIDLVAGMLCIGSAGLNAWNMFGVGLTAWRLTAASILAVIGLFLLARYFRSKPDAT